VAAAILCILCDAADIREDVLRFDNRPNQQNLESGLGAIAMQRTIRTILLCGNDSILLNTREMLLIHAGFLVSSCSDKDIALMPQTPQIDLTVMGHTMTVEQSTRTAQLVRSKWPDTKLLFLTQADGHLSRISESEYESGSSNPSHLIQACRQILED